LTERRTGTFKRLSGTPAGPFVLLSGKLLPFLLINLVQVAIMLASARLIFGLDLGRSFGGLFVVSVTIAASATALGVLVAALARTEAQVGGLTTILLLTLSALGGCFVPRFVMPEWLRTAGLVTPHAWALEGFQDLLVRGQGLMDVLPEAGALAGFTLVFLLAGILRFRFD
jgi:ABC-2 type transport system permease protein